MTDENSISKLKSKPQDLNFHPILQIELLKITELGYELILTDSTDSIRALYLGPKKSELAIGQFLSLTNYLYKPETLEIPLIFFSFNPITEPLPKYYCKNLPSSVTTNSSQSELFPVPPVKFNPFTISNHEKTKYFLSTFEQILSLTIDPTKTKVFYTLCNIGLIKKDRYSSLFYKSCMNDRCKKKVLNINLDFYCPKCQNSYTQFKYSYVVDLPLIDSTRSVNAVVFDNCARKLFDMPADVFAYRVSQDNADQMIFKVFGKKIVAGLRVRQQSGIHCFELFDVHDALEAFHTVLFELSLCK